jgi:hypothetical protein
LSLPLPLELALTLSSSLDLETDTEGSRRRESGTSSPSRSLRSNLILHSPSPSIRLARAISQHLREPVSKLTTLQLHLQLVPRSSSKITLDPKHRVPRIGSRCSLPTRRLRSCDTLSCESYILGRGVAGGLEALGDESTAEQGTLVRMQREERGDGRDDCDVEGRAVVEVLLVRSDEGGLLTSVEPLNRRCQYGYEGGGVGDLHS